LATIRNTIDTQFTSRGARGVQQDTESVGRAQTRMGQASAGAGRSFAAQSQGLGGLVGAYAGAAATVFALEAAFTALAKSAQAETIVKGTSALASGIAQSGPRIIKTLQEITQGQLTMAEAAQNANIGLSAGFDSTQIEGLTKVAMGASRALGRNLTDSLQRVFRGVAKLEPELLDELGIFVRIEPAVNAYARQLGVAAKSLSQFERGQAFANAAIEEGTRKFGMIDVSAPSAQKSLEQLNTQVMELALEFGQLLTQILLPFVNFLKNDAGNALVLFGGILLLVFSKALTMIGAFTMGGITKFTVFADAFIAKTGGMRAAMEALNASQLRYMAGLGKAGTAGMTGAVAGASSADRKSQLGGMGFRANTIDKTGRFDSVAGRKEGAAGVSTPKMRKEATAARKDFIAGNLKTGKAVRDARRQLELMNTTLRANSQASQQATAIISALAGAQTRMGTATLFASRALALFKKAAIGLGAILGGIMSAISGLFLILAVLDLAGVDVFGRIKDFFVDNSQAAANFKSAVVGAFTAAAGGAGELTTALKGLGATDDELEKVGDVIKDLRSDLIREQTRVSNLPLPGGQTPADFASNQNSALARLNMANSPVARDPVSGAATLTAAQESQVKGNIRSRRSQLETNAQSITDPVTKQRALNLAKEEEIRLLELVKDVTGGVIAQQARFNQQLIDATTDVKLVTIAQREHAKQLALVTGEGINATYEMRERLELLAAAVELYGQLDDAVLPVIGSLGRLTGIRLDSLTEMFSNKPIVPVGTTNQLQKLETEITANKNSVNIFGIEVQKVADKNQKMVFSFESLSKAQRGLAESAVIVSNAVRQANDDFENGSTSADKLSSVIAGANAAFANNKDNITQYAKEIKAASHPHSQLQMSLADATDQAVKFFDVLKERVKGLIKLRNELKKIETIFKALTSTFSGDIKTMDSLRFSGLITDMGNLADGLNGVEAASNAVLTSILNGNNAFKQAADVVKAYDVATTLALEPLGSLDPTDQGLVKNRVKPGSDQVANAEVYNKAVAAGAGKVTKMGIALKDNLREELKIHNVKKLQLEVQQKQANVAQKQAEMSVLQSARARAATTVQNTLVVNQTTMQTHLLAQKHEQSRLDFDIAVSNQKSANALASQAGTTLAAHKFKIAQLRNAKEMLIIEQERAELADKPFATDKERKDTELELINLKKGIAKDEFSMRLKAIKAEGGVAAAKNAQDQKVLKEKYFALRLEVMLFNEQRGEFYNQIELERTMFTNKQAEATNKAAHEETMAKKAVEILKAQETLQGKQRELDTLNRTDQRAADDLQRENMLTFLKGVSGFTVAIAEMGKIVNQQMGIEGAPSSASQAGLVVAKIIKDADATQAGIDRQRNTRDNLRTNTTSGIDTIEKSIMTKRIAEAQSLVSQKGSIKDALVTTQKAQQSNFDATISEKLANKGRELALLDLQLKGLENEASAAGVETQYQIIEATEEYDNLLVGLGNDTKNASRALGTFDTDMMAISDTLDSSLITAFSDLGDIMLGLGDETKSFGQQVTDVFRSFMMSIIKEIQMQMIVKPLAGMAQSAISGFFMAGGGPVHMAAGGSVRHMADGGQVNALRDRVPTMLEPGEFVIRKNSAKSIGRSKLGQMNSTGSASAGNVQFNIVNEGSAKQAEQQGPAKIDTDKIVIDVVMRDLANNGPIRKALRNG